MKHTKKEINAMMNDTITAYAKKSGRVFIFTEKGYQNETKRINKLIEMRHKNPYYEEEIERIGATFDFLKAIENISFDDYVLELKAHIPYYLHKKTSLFYEICRTVLDNQKEEEKISSTDVDIKQK